MRSEAEERAGGENVEARSWATRQEIQRLVLLGNVLMVGWTLSIFC